jgi:hypothetical protein
MNSDYLECLLFAQLGKNSGHSPSKHCLARARWSDEQYIVAAGGGDFERPFCAVLSYDV